MKPSQTLKNLYVLIVILVISYSCKKQDESNPVSKILPNYVPANSLLGWWSFSGNADDISGNKNNGIVYGASLTADRFGNQNSAYHFNGTSNYIEVADTPGLRLNDTDFTISFWVKIDTYNTIATALIVKRINGSQNGWLLVASGSYNNRIQLAASQGSDPAVFSNSPLSVNVWHHVVLVYQQSSMLNFYFDGILSSSHSSGGLYFNPGCTAPLRFGHDTQNPARDYFINGSMDDIGIWNRALTPQEVSNLYK